MRELHYDETTADIVLSRSVFDDIARTRTVLVILPNMHTLNWKAPLSLCVMFMCSNVTRFAIHLPIAIAKASPRPFFDDIIDRMPRLHVIDIRTKIPARTLEKELSRLLSSLPDLRKISFPRFYLTSSLCACCSRLPKLGCVDFQYYDEQGSGDPADVAVFQPDFFEGAFPSLGDLSLNAGYRDVQRFLTIPFTPTNLTVLHVESSQFESPAHLHQLLVAISENCQMLKGLMLLSPRRVLGDHSTVSDGFNQVTADTLKPALVCSSLTSFAIVHQFPLKLMQKDLEIFAKSWVSLETLNLNAEPYHIDSSDLTLEALLPFAQYCPHLTYLALFIDATAPSLSTISPHPRFKCLQHLAIGFSIVDEPLSVAYFLSRILPLGCHIDIGATWSDNFDTESGDEMILSRRYDEWSEVNHLLPTLITVREEEREGMKELQRELDRARGHVHDLTEQLDALFGMTES